MYSYSYNLNFKTTFITIKNQPLITSNIDYVAQIKT